MNNKNKFGIYVLSILIVFTLMQSAFSEVTIKDAKIFGQNSKYNGFVGKNETVMISMNISKDNSYLPSNYTINVSYIFLTTPVTTKINPGIYCNKIEGTTYNYSKCEFTINKKGSSSTATEQIIVKLYNDKKIQQKEQTLSIVSDVSAPRLTNIVVDSDAVTTKLNVYFNDGTGQCSKINKIEVYNEFNNLINEGTINNNQCSGNFEFVLPTVDLGKGNHTLKVKLYDNVGNSGNGEKNIVITQVPVEVDLSGGFNVLDINNKPVKYCLSNYDDLVTISFTVNVQDTLFRIEADSSEIGGGLKILDPNRDCKSFGGGNLYCSFKSRFSCSTNLEDTTVTKNLKVTLKDNSIHANLGYIDIPTSFEVDRTDPEVSGMSNIIDIPNKQIVESSLVFVGKNAHVLMVVNEQSGVSAQKSYLKMNGINFNFQSCEQYEGNSYSCEIKGFAITEDKCTGLENSLKNNCTGKLYVEDYNGNSVNYSFAYVVDNDDPKIENNSLRIGSQTSDIGFIPSFIIDKSQIVLYSVVSELPLLLSLNQPTNKNKNVLGENITTNCNYFDKSTGKRIEINNYKGETNVIKTCDVAFEVVSDSVDNGEIELYISDFAGNYYHQTLNVTVLEHESNNSNLYTFSNPQLMQGTVTRDSAAVGTQKLMFKSKYSYINNGTKADMAQVVINQQSCKFVDSGKLLGVPSVDFVTSNTVYFNIEMKKSSRSALEKYNTLDLICNATIFAIKDGKKLASEAETIKFIVPLSDDPQSTVGSALDQKIKDAMDDSKLKLAKKLKSIEKFIRQARKLCNMIGTIGKVSNMMNMNLFAQHQVTKAAPGPQRPALEQKDRTQDQGPVNKATEGVKKITDKMMKFCGIFNCNKQEDSGFGSALTKDTVIPGIGRGSMINPHGSLVGSMATMCITGFFDNLNRYKFIKCVYIDCLKNRVPKGTPILVCEQEYKYEMCKYEAGQTLNMIPFLNIFRTVGQQIGSILQNPTSLLMGSVWEKQCKVGTDVDQSTLCKTMKGLKTIAEIKKQLDNAKYLDKMQSEMDKVCKSAGVD